MGDLKTNRDALEQVLQTMFPAQPRENVQRALEDQQTPIRSISIAAGVAATWQQYDIRGYSILVLPGDPAAQLSATPAYLRFGTDAPPDASSTAGAWPAYAGSVIEIPQGASKFWFLSPDTAMSWLLCVTRIPHLKLTPGPLAARLPNQQVLSTSLLTTLGTAPSALTDGAAVPAQAKRCRVHIAEQTGGTYTRLVTSADLDIWWVPEKAGDAPRLWAHNPADDFDVAGLGQATASHDCETYDCEGLSRIYVALVTGGGPVTAAIVTWLG